MTIEFVEGDIFESPAQTIVNTVNCKGVMGKGLASKFKKKYPLAKPNNAKLKRKIAPILSKNDVTALGTLRKAIPLPNANISCTMAKAMIMLEEIEIRSEGLPGLDCGSCGAPSCRALAEDIVRGIAIESDCVFKLRDKVRALAKELMALEEIRPPGLDRQ